MLNLFLALLLNAFASDGLKSDDKADKEDSKVMQGWRKLKNIFKKSKPTVSYTYCLLVHIMKCTCCYITVDQQ